jgi:putative endonuclease
MSENSSPRRLFQRETMRWLASLFRRGQPRGTPVPTDPRRGRGLSAEEAAARTLRRLGYRVRARNVRFRFGELDLVCEHRGTLVFVEVKARTSSDHGHPLEAVTPHKQRQLVRLAEAYLRSLRGPPPPCRFDVVAVELDAHGRPGRVEVLPDAFSADLVPTRRASGTPAVSFRSERRGTGVPKNRVV